MIGCFASLRNQVGADSLNYFYISQEYNLMGKEYLVGMQETSELMQQMSNKYFGHLSDI